MVGVFWMLIVVFCPLVLSQSGDDDWSDKEVTCTSTLTLNQSNLTCSLNDEPTEEVKFMKLCKMHGEGSKKECKDAIPGPRNFIFKDLIVTAKYQLNIGDEVIEKDIDLSQIIKITAPEMKLATYMEDTEEVFIWFEYSHEYVKTPKFQVEIWGGTLLYKPISPTINYRNFTISRDRFGGDGVYYTRVRAKPAGYFDGDWSEWSSNASFTIKSECLHVQVEGSRDPQMHIVCVASREQSYICVVFLFFLFLFM